MENFQYRNLNREALKARLYKIGTVSNVYTREGDDDQRDRLNNPKKIFTNSGKTIIFAHWRGATDEERDLTTGEFNKVTPTFIFPFDSVIEDDAHVFYDEIEYEITATTSRGNHIVADGKEVSVLTKETENVSAFDEDGRELELPIYE